MKNFLLGLGGVVLALVSALVGYNTGHSSSVQRASVGLNSYDQQNFAAVNISGATVHSGTTALNGAVSITGALTSTAAVTVGRFIGGGAAEAQTAVATSTLSASSVCNNSFLSITPVSTTPTITLPSTTTLFASCLATVGQYHDVVYKAITTSTILAPGAGGTILNSSSLTVAAGKGAILRFVHDTASAGGTYLVYLLNAVN